MNMTGMIYQFNQDEGVGLIMLSNGETKEFNTQEWVDESNTPSVGLKISYATNDSLVRIKMYDGIKTAKSTIEFTGIDEYIDYFIAEGYKLIKDFATEASRTVTLRRYVVDEHSEVIIKRSKDEISVTKTRNGKVVSL